MAAVQQLMQLSDEDSNNNEKRCSKRDSNDDQSRSEITSALIEEIFGKEDRGVSFEEEKQLVAIIEASTCQIINKIIFFFILAA
ncbi:hypothetical protein CMV_001419 [Castanea mollissima]|uniref:Uncharacterized protein n=1 Tax=Castanea mollissima TaxID=60419 RepID=A0A8J4RVW0_9ROSI|nr:hypothetical protein CMV_001419 [Castanea mollissima]